MRITDGHRVSTCKLSGDRARSQIKYGKYGKFHLRCRPEEIVFFSFFLSFYPPIFLRLGSMILWFVSCQIRREGIRGWKIFTIVDLSSFFGVGKFVQLYVDILFTWDKVKYEIRHRFVVRIEFYRQRIGECKIKFFR